MAAAPDPVDQEHTPMTQPLRRAHFRIWVAMAVTLCAIFVAGLRLRRTTTPPNPNLHWEEYR